MWQRSMRSCDQSEGTHVSASLPEEATVGVNFRLALLPFDIHFQPTQSSRRPYSAVLLAVVLSPRHHSGRRRRQLRYGSRSTAYAQPLRLYPVVSPPHVCTCPYICICLSQLLLLVEAKI